MVVSREMCLIDRLGDGLVELKRCAPKRHAKWHALYIYTETQALVERLCRNLGWLLHARLALRGLLRAIYMTRSGMGPIR